MGSGGARSYNDPVQLEFLNSFYNAFLGIGGTGAFLFWLVV